MPNRQASSLLKGDSGVPNSKLKHTRRGCRLNEGSIMDPRCFGHYPLRMGIILSSATNHAMKSANKLHELLAMVLETVVFGCESFENLKLAHTRQRRRLNTWLPQP